MMLRACGAVRRGRLFALLATALVPPGAALADDGDASFAIAEQAALFAARPAAPARATGAEVWGSGLTRAEAKPVPSSDRAIGIRLPPAPMTGIAFGWELRRPDEPAASSQSDVTWGYKLKGRNFGLDALSWGLRTDGRLNVFDRGLSQSLASDLSLALPDFLPFASTRLRISPELNYQAIPNTVSVAAGPELAARTELYSPIRSLKSALDVSLGYRFSSEAKPGLAASVALTFRPAL